MAASFRLARLRRLREQVRRLRQLEADRLTARLAATAAEVAAVVAARQRVGADEAAAALAGTLSLEALRLSRLYDAALASAETECSVRAERERADLTAKREELTRDRQAERKLDRLAETHRQRVSEEETRAADRALDELAMARHVRAQGG